MEALQGNLPKHGKTESNPRLPLNKKQQTDAFTAPALRSAFRRGASSSRSSKGASGLQALWNSAASAFRSPTDSGLWTSAADVRSRRGKAVETWRGENSRALKPGGRFMLFWLLCLRLLFFFLIFGTSQMAVLIMTHQSMGGGGVVRTLRVDFVSSFFWKIGFLEESWWGGCWVGRS